MEYYIVQVFQTRTSYSFYSVCSSIGAWPNGVFRKENGRFNLFSNYFHRSLGGLWSTRLNENLSWFSCYIIYMEFLAFNRHLLEILPCALWRENRLCNGQDKGRGLSSFSVKFWFETRAQRKFRPRQEEFLPGYSWLRYSKVISVTFLKVFLDNNC